MEWGALRYLSFTFNPLMMAWFPLVPLYTFSSQRECPYLMWKYIYYHLTLSFLRVANEITSSKMLTREWGAGATRTLNSSPGPESG